MTSEEFVQVVKLQTSDGVSDGIIELIKDPPERRPAEKLLRFSRWYKQLSSLDRQMLQELLREAAEHAIFGLFCILDGVCVIEDGPDKGELELFLRKMARAYA